MLGDETPDESYRNASVKIVIVSGNSDQTLKTHIWSKHSIWRLTWAGNKHCHLSVKCDPLTKTHVQSKHRFRHLMWQESEQVLTRGEGPCLNQQQQLIIVYSCVPWKVTVSTMFSSKHLKFSRIKNSSRLWMMNCSRTSKWANNVFHFLGTSLIRSGLWIFPFPKWQGLFQAEHKSEWQHLTCVDMSSKPGWWWWFGFGIRVQFT